MGPVIVTDRPKKKKKIAKTVESKPKVEPKNLFSDATARFLLRLIKGKRDLPEVLPGLRPEYLKRKQIESESPQKTDSKDVQEELADAIRERLRPWLWSFLLHVCLLIPFALLFLPGIRHDYYDIILRIGETENQILQDSLLGNQDNNEPTIITPQDLSAVEDPMPQTAKTETVEVAPDSVLDETTAEATTISLSGREPGSRPVLLGGAGGTGQTDIAVIAGLRWLVRVQQNDGSWHLAGPFRDGAPRNNENKIAATGMALLAFQGYGVTPSSKHPSLTEFSAAVRNGWDWLLRQQDEKSGVFFKENSDGRNYSHRFYTHGICTIALCELLAMTGDESLRSKAQAAVDYCLKHQSFPSGGWRYYADRWSPQSDVSVTGWIVMALKSGQSAGLTVPKESFEKVMQFLDSMGRDDGSQYIYREEEPEKRVSMTAEALLCRELLGWKHDDRRLTRGMEILVDEENLPRFDSQYKRDAYYWYYATQALFHYGGDPWTTWNRRMRDELPKHQETKGFEAGSWNPIAPVRDEWGRSYGRLYTTCLSIYMLEVYYRHLRVYR